MKSREDTLTQPFGHPGQVFLGHVGARPNYVLHCHCSQGIDAGGHCTGVEGQQNHNYIYCLMAGNPEIAVYIHIYLSS